MTARFSWNQGNTRGHRPRLQEIRHYLDQPHLSPRPRHRTFGRFYSGRSGSIITAVELRFALKLPVEFRRIGSDRSLVGYTEDMGSARVLLRAGEWVQPTTRIEMVFRRPAADPCDLICNGVVLRVELPEQPGLLPTIAATIEDYKFSRR